MTTTNKQDPSNTGGKDNTDLSRIQRRVSQAELDYEAVCSASADFDAKWDAFRNRFDSAIQVSISKIAEALGATNLQTNAGGEMSLQEAELSDEQRKQVLPGGVTIAEVAKGMAKRKFKRVVVMAGAGISVTAGIPDFRTPGTGLYDNLQKYNLPSPQSVFDINYFTSEEVGEGPTAFYSLAKEMWPGQYNPTPTHHFISMLREKGLLLRCFTQNIDGLERLAGMPGESLVEAHGTFSSAHCCRCRTKLHISVLKAQIRKDPSKVPRCKACKEGLVKPDIVFFGEELPSRFSDKVKTDFRAPEEGGCDLLIVLGTSLAVHPFAGLITKVAPTVPRVLINREAVGEDQYGGFRFSKQDNYRDVLCEGDCDAQVLELAEMMGWRQELEERMNNFAQPSGLSDDDEPPQKQNMSMELLLFKFAEKKKKEQEAREAAERAGGTCKGAAE
mmetsp:Transcript_17592/g.21088  ORF Transcript_17592/g.21088 Transcript_17592/m.21088 type:complete len:445 (-) Transcript_17592:152-1486(-)|eukprot:CAMPEP_0197852292 /NCGR_PEP_ID=MMETSP1438-20131217/20195_1 /TAXON_ID=1461541 /ORGANISM="Pterosperma sp., Strain CCMP1384" /LENGTH=444 /DNA_ID=CAMNT_0043466265 /DNA_START=256 /DNA_END=1590 /DNA_ORIENTATION=-